MTTSIRRACRGIEDCPSPAAVRELADEGHHLILEICPTDPEFRPNLHAIIDHFARELPEFTVFDGGGAVTIKRVISSERVLLHADAIVAAAIQFQFLAEDLMLRLSSKLDLPLEVFFGLDYRPFLGRGWFRNRWSGKVDRTWRYAFHGYECWFKSQITGQTLDVRLGFTNEFGVLDPYFFHNFVATTPGLEIVASLLQDHFHDPRRALMVLEQHGRLKRITEPRTGRRGLTPPRP